MFDVNFCNCFLNLRKDLASEELAKRSEDLLRCLWLGNDALLLLPSCDVIFVGVWWPVSMETSSGMLCVLEFILRTDHRRPGLDLKSMFTVSKNFSLLFLSIRLILAHKLRNFSLSLTDGCDFSLTRTDSFFLIRSRIALDSQGTGQRPFGRFVGVLSFTAAKKRYFQAIDSRQVCTVI